MILILRLISLLGYHLVLAGQYRLAGVLPNPWMAYAGMGLLFLIRCRDQGVL